MVQVLNPPPFVHIVPVISAKDMFAAVCKYAETQDIIIKSAAVADYRPTTVSEEKMKKSDGELSISLERTDDILQYLGQHKKKTNLYVVSPWKQKICWKTPDKNWKRKMQI